MHEAQRHALLCVPHCCFKDEMACPTRTRYDAGTALADAPTLWKSAERRRPFRALLCRFSARPSPPSACPSHLARATMTLSLRMRARLHDPRLNLSGSCDHSLPFSWCGTHIHVESGASLGHNFSNVLPIVIANVTTQHRMSEAVPSTIPAANVVTIVDELQRAPPCGCAACSSTPSSAQLVICKLHADGVHELPHTMALRATHRHPRGIHCRLRRVVSLLSRGAGSAFNEVRSLKE